MATDCADGDYLGAYARFFAEFVARMNPDDQLPVKVSAYDVNEGEIVGEIISVTLQYLNKTYCPPSLQSYIVRLVIQAIKSTCKKQPEICGLRQQEKTYAPLKLMQAITNEVNEICRRYLDNSRLALLPPPSSIPQVVVGAIRNGRRKMEDRHVVLHDLHTIFNIQDDLMANYYAVFDGHGGQDAAAYCATHLHQYLAESVHYPTDPERALRDAFMTTDAQFIAKSGTKRLNSGTTAVCVLILDKKLYIAWVGDSMASLVKRGYVKQLVDPHRPTREDEKERIHNMGGIIVNCDGVMRVNGFLNISRAIGDVSYKPYVTGEPEIRCVSLDGSEDFLIIACDGLWDHVEPRTAAHRVYRQVLQSPRNLEHVHQSLLQSAKRAGSRDNITVIVVFLTPPIEIASRPLNAHPLLTYPTPNGLLNNMDPNNPFLSNANTKFDENPTFVKQERLYMGLEQHGTDLVLPDTNLVFYDSTSSNGKHVEDADGNDDYDYGDLGPETNVDTVDDAPDAQAPLDKLSRELIPGQKPEQQVTEDEREDNDRDDNDNNDNDERNENESQDRSEYYDFNRYNTAGVPYDGNGVIRTRILGKKDENDAGTDDNVPLEHEADSDSRAVRSDARIDDDESPPSPPRDANSAARWADEGSPYDDAEPLEHALISEEDNETNSEESDDEWNFITVDKFKGKWTSPDDEKKRKNIQENFEPIVKDSSEVQPSEEGDNIKCEAQEKDNIPPLTDEDELNSSGELENPGCVGQELEKQIDENVWQENLEAIRLLNSKDQHSETEHDIKCEKREEDTVPSLVNDSDLQLSEELQISSDREKQVEESDEEEKKDLASVNEKDTLPPHISNNTGLVLSEELEKGDLVSARQEELKTQLAIDMDFQLNPNAAEFVPMAAPVSPTLPYTPNIADFPISGSPLKQSALVMDDIPIPSQSEFEEEVCQRPREVDEKDYTNGDPQGLDVSEISSTKAELGDESIARIMATTQQWQTDSSQWSTRMRDDAGSEPEEYDIAKDPMAMSLAPDDFDVAFEKSVDLNAVHNLSGIDNEDDENIGSLETPPRTPEPYANEEDPCTPFSDNKVIDHLHASSTPHPDEKSKTVLENDVAVTNNLSDLESEHPDSPMEQLGVSPLTDNSMEHETQKTESVASLIDNDEAAKLIECESVNESVHDIVSNLLETSLAGSCAKEFTPFSTSPIQDMLECSLPKPMDEIIPSTEAALSNETTLLDSASTVPLSDLPADVPEYQTKQCSLDPFALDLISGADDAMLLKDSLDVNVPVSTQNTENLILDFTELSSEEPKTDICMKEEKAAEENTQAVSETLTNLITQQQTDNQSSPVINPDFAYFLLPTIQEIQLKKELAMYQKYKLEVNEMVSSNIPEQEREKEAVLEDSYKNIDEVPEKEVVLENTPSNEIESEPKQPTMELLPESVVIVDKPKEEIAEGIADTTAGVIAATAIATVAAVTTTATAAPIASSIKAKATKRSTKSATTTMKTTPHTMKVATKSTPTSPSKTISSTTTRTASAQPATTKKLATSTAARPKQLDGSAKMTNQVPVNKTAAVRMITKTTTPTATKTTASARAAVGTTKPKTTTAAAASKPSAATSLAEKKPTASGDAKTTSSKFTAFKPASKTISNGVKTTPVKSSSTTTRTSVSAVTSKPRPASATSSAKVSSAAASKPATSVTTSRPKTAPTSTNTTKLRESTAKATTVKSPMIDKQIKETANKQISLGRIGTSPMASKTGRASAPAVIGTTAGKSRTLTPKLSNASAASPIKKLTPTSKTVASRVSAAGVKTALSNNKTKTLPNNVGKNKIVSNDVVTTTANDKLGDDDVPRKDASPVDVSTDNQLIVSAD